MHELRQDASGPGTVFVHFFLVRHETLLAGLELLVAPLFLAAIQLDVVRMAPFLLALVRRGASHPYFLAWFENDALFVKAEG